MAQTVDPSIGPIVNANGGNPQDMIAVYDSDQGIDCAPLWRGRQRGGLNPGNAADARTAYQGGGCRKKP